jgi:ubiquinone/menaquinone biosynthesis C-methylase UbiE
MAETYDRLAAGYDRAMRPLERWLLGRLRAAAFAGLPDKGRLLEVGVGTGANFPFYPPGARAAGVEPSREMLARARARPEAPAGLRLVRARAERLPFAAGTFDAAFASLLLCSVEDPLRALAELRRVVRAGGSVVLLEHVRPVGALGYLFDALSRLTVALCDDHFNRRTADDARRAGLRVERVERHALGIVQIIVCRVE